MKTYQLILIRTDELTIQAENMNDAINQSEKIALEKKCTGFEIIPGMESLIYKSKLIFE